MNYIKFFKSFNEAITISQYKEWSAYTNWVFYNKMGEYFKKFQNHDASYNRVYFDIEVDSDNFEVIIPDEIKDFFGWYGYRIIDYQSGICRDENGSEIRIGKLLNRLGEEKLLQTYNKSKENTLKNINERLNFFLDYIGKETVTEVRSYKCI